MGPPGGGFAAQGFGGAGAGPGGRGPPRLLLTGELDLDGGEPANANPPARFRGGAERNPFSERPEGLPPIQALAPAIRAPGTPPDDAVRPGAPRPGSRGTPPGSRGGARPRAPPGGGGGGGGGGGSADPRIVRELEERLVVAESQNAAQAARLRNLERRVAVSEAARKEELGGERGANEALESRVSALQQAHARAESFMAEMRGRVEAAEADVKETRAQAMRVEAAAQVAMVGARDNFDQIQQRIGIEQGSDARRLDQLSAEIARLTRDVADARGEDSAKRQILEANIARVEGQRNSDNALQQVGDVRSKLNATEELCRALAEQLEIEKRGRADAEARFEQSVARLEEVANAREQALMRKFERDLDDKLTELNRKVADEVEEAALRDQDIIREKDDQMSAFERGSKKERQKNIEHQMILEKAIREEHTARVAQVDALSKAVDRVNHDVVALLTDEKVAREARESKLRGQISQSVIKLHEQNKETREKLHEERDALHAIVKTEIKARMGTLDAMHAAMKKSHAETERVLAAGRVEAAQAVRTAEVKLSRRVGAVEQRVEVEVAALRKLYARQTQLELDLDVFKRDVVDAFDVVQEDLTVAAVAQALNTEADNVQAEYVTDTVEELQTRIETQDRRDRDAAEALEAAVFGPTPAGEPGLRDRVDKSHRDLVVAFDKLSQHALELDRVREVAAEDKREALVLVEELKEEMDYNACAQMTEAETLQMQIDIASAEVAGAADMIEGKLREKVGELAERNKVGVEAIRSEMHAPLANLRAALDAEVVARTKTDADVEAEVAARNAAVAALWNAAEANYAAQVIESELLAVEGEEFALEQARASDLNAEREAELRDAALAKLQDKLQASIEEEAAERRRGDDRVRHAYEDDVANLEDTAAEAVRELREGLRDEIAERSAQARTLHADLTETLENAKHRLERDVRALEETAAGNIAAQKLEEEMLRAELDDGLLRVDEALEELERRADARAEEARRAVDAHAAEIKGKVAEECEPVEGRVEALKSVVDTFASRFDAQDAKLASTLPRADFASAVDADRAETERAFRQVHADVARIEQELANAAIAAVTEVETTRLELEASVEANARQQVDADAALGEALAATRRELETEIKTEGELVRAETAGEIEAGLREERRAREDAVDDLRARVQHAASDAKMDVETLRAELEDADDQIRAGADVAREEQREETREAIRSEAEAMRSRVEAEAAARTAGEESVAKRVGDAEGKVEAMGETVREGLGLNAEAMTELRGDVVAVKAELAEMKAAGGGGGAESAASVPPPAPPPAPPPPPEPEPEAAPEPEPEPEAAPEPEPEPEAAPEAEAEGDPAEEEKPPEA